MSKGKIWKYSLDPYGVTTLEIPQEAKILSVQTQYEVPTLWVLVDPQNPIETRRFVPLTTGSVVRDNEEYIGTCLMSNGFYIVHIHEVTPQ